MEYDEASRAARESGTSFAEANAITMADAADSAALVLAVYESERTGGWVEIPNY